MEKININELKERQNNGEKLLVDFFATWCGPCKSLTPRLENLEKLYPNVSFVKLDIEENMQELGEYGITSVPTVLVYDGVNFKSKSVGLNTDSFYKGLLEQL
jgi:thioredoxin 1